MVERSTFFPEVIDEFASARILGVRSGKEHRYTAVWVVVVERKVFLRSWNDQTEGWYRAFVAEPRGSVRLNDREIAVRARRTRSERLQKAVSKAYAEKYVTKGSKEWVIGFAQPRRQRTTLELLPA